MLPWGGYGSTMLTASKFRPYRFLLKTRDARHGTLDKLGAVLGAEIDEGGLEGLGLALPGAAGGGAVVGFARIMGAEGGLHILAADVAEELLAAEADGDGGIDTAVDLLAEALVVFGLDGVERSDQIEFRVSSFGFRGLREWSLGLAFWVCAS